MKHTVVFSWYSNGNVMVVFIMRIYQPVCLISLSSQVWNVVFAMPMSQGNDHAVYFYYRVFKWTISTYTFKHT